MKSEIIEDQTNVTSEFKAGELYKSDKGMVLLCTEDKETFGPLCGTVVYAPKNYVWPVGHHSDDWSVSGFIPFKGELKLIS